jgi:bifunctional non-homologous end joining protein LigD
MAPAVAQRRAARDQRPSHVIPRDRADVVVGLGKRQVKLTNLQKPFWPALGLTKGDLIRYYVDVAPVLLPHIRDRAMVMRRYPNGAGGPSFFMKRAPTPRPDWIELCSIEHASGNVIDFPMIQDLPSLLWVVNLGCIDLNQWYARCDDVDRPDYLHFDLDPGPGVAFGRVLEAARILHATLDGLGMPSHAKTTGSRACTSTCRSCGDRRRSRSGPSPSCSRWRPRASTPRS